MRILHAIHDYLPRHRAGSEIYAHGLASTQAARGDEVHVVCAEYDPARPHGSLDWREVDEIPVTEIVNNWEVERLEDCWESPVVDRRLDEILRIVGPDVVHVHNLLNLSLGLPGLAARRGIPTLATLHDFTLVCPSGGQRIHRAEEHVCHEIDLDRCARCFPQSPFHQQTTLARLGRRGGGLARLAAVGRRVRGRWPALFAALGTRASAGPLALAVSAAALDRRLGRVREVCREVDLFVAPSAALGEDLVRFVLPPDRVEVSDYGFPPLLGGTGATPTEAGTGPELVIGFVGTLAWHKGVHVLVDAAARLGGRDGWRVEIHGALETFPDYSRELQRAAEGLPILFAGGFAGDRVAEVHGRLDVLVVPSLWPENSPLVIHEAFQAGRPVVGSRSGGTPGLVRPGRGGWLVEPGDAEELATVLGRLIDDRGEVRREAASLPEVKSLAVDAAEWDARYRRALDRSPSRRTGTDGR